jgi:hypothetical protein
MIKPLILTSAIRASTQTPCPTSCGAERLFIKQWITSEDYDKHRAGETVEYQHSLYCQKCGYDEKAALVGTAPVVHPRTRKEERDSEWEEMTKRGVH